MKKKLLLILSLYLFSFNLFGQVWTPPGVNSRPTSDTFTYDFGINQYNKDTYLYLAPGLNMNFDNKWGFSMQLPVNILLNDAEPKTPGAKVGQVRSIDYDSKSDYQRILNNIWVGNYGVYKPKEITYSLFVGRMYDGYIGHGTIINRYVNNQRVDVYKLGVMADINTDYGGVQVFTNSIYDRKEVNAGRGYIRPYGIITGIMDLVSGKKNIAMLAANGNVLDDVGRKKVNEEINSSQEEERYVEVETDPKTGEKKEVEKTAPKKERVFDNEEAAPNKVFDLNRFAIGYTSAYDGTAPTALDLDTTGSIRFDKTNNAKVKSNRKQGIEGYDAEFKIISTDTFELTPYADYNRIKNVPNSLGRHYGVITKIGTKEINVIIRPEFRSMSSNYIPMYFDSFYEIERYQVNLDTSFPYTKYEALQNKPTDGTTVKGYFNTFIVNIYKVGFEVNYEDYKGKNNSRVFLGAYIPFGTLFRFSAFYTKKGFDKNNEAFKVDDKAQGAVEVAINLGPLTLKLQNRRRWVLDSDTNQFKAKDEQMIFFSGGTAF
ncbi:MAG: hypothetical protein IPQ05_19405 [Leptospiraceae bacterium]|nr:hypothetical protein [Leptospiraceae bacterium]